MCLEVDEFQVYDIDFVYPFNDTKHSLLHKFRFDYLNDEIQYFSNDGRYFYSDERVYKVETSKHVILKQISGSH
jgi:hypothetical protein